MQDCYKKIEMWTKHSIAKLSLVGLWGTEHDATITRLKRNPSHAVRLALSNITRELCLFTDTSRSFPTRWQIKIMSHLHFYRERLMEALQGGVSRRSRLSP